MPLVRRAATSILLLLATLSAGSWAYAQDSDTLMLPQAPPLPVATDLSKVPIGRWSQYVAAMGGKELARQRVSLVGRTASHCDMELLVEGGRFQRKILTKVQLSLRASKRGRVKRAVMRVGAGDGMEIPGESDLASEQLPPIDPKKYVDSRDITVPAGVFKAKRYRDALPGVTIDYWVNEEATPLGIVKVEFSFAERPEANGSMILIAQGDGAHATVLKRVRPFDEEKLLADLATAMRGAPAKPNKD